MDTAEFQVAIVYIKVNSITGCSDRLPGWVVPVVVAIPIVLLLVLLLLYLYLRKRKATNPSGGKPPPAAGPRTYTLHPSAYRSGHKQHKRHMLLVRVGRAGEREEEEAQAEPDATSDK